MNHAHDDDDPIEHDPTGMRALLSSLPDPGPMPADLVDRIRAELAQEQERRSDPAGGPESLDAPVATPGHDGGTVVPLRRRAGALRILGAAAAVVGVLGLGGLLVDATSSGGAIASLTAGGSDDSGSASGGAAAPENQGEKSSSDGVQALSDDGRTAVLDGSGSLNRDELAAVAAALPRGPFRAGVSAASPSASDISGLPVTTVGGARACATGLGVPAEDEVVVRLSVVDGEPAALLVATAPSGARTAWALGRDCSATAPGVLAGPVPVG